MSEAKKFQDMLKSLPTILGMESYLSLLIDNNGNVARGMEYRFANSGASIASHNGLSLVFIVSKDDFWNYWLGFYWKSGSQCGYCQIAANNITIVANSHGTIAATTSGNYQYFVCKFPLFPV